jgi:hypothetical protein
LVLGEQGRTDAGAGRGDEEGAEGDCEGAEVGVAFACCYDGGGAYCGADDAADGASTDGGTEGVVSDCIFGFA